MRCAALVVPTALLFEIIYPENRIVVDYRGESKLVLLAGIETVTGNDISHAALLSIAETWGVSEQMECDDWRTLHDAYADTPHHEGFVLITTPPFRVQTKLAQYVCLHRLLRVKKRQSISRLAPAPASCLHSSTTKTTTTASGN